MKTGNTMTTTLLATSIVSLYVTGDESIIKAALMTN